MFVQQYINSLLYKNTLKLTTIKDDASLNTHYCPSKNILSCISEGRWHSKVFVHLLPTPRLRTSKTAALSTKPQFTLWSRKNSKHQHNFLLNSKYVFHFYASIADESPRVFYSSLYLSLSIFALHAAMREERQPCCEASVAGKRSIRASTGIEGLIFFFGYAGKCKVASKLQWSFFQLFIFLRSTSVICHTSQPRICIIAVIGCLSSQPIREMTQLCVITK